MHHSSIHCWKTVIIGKFWLYMYKHNKTFQHILLYFITPPCCWLIPYNCTLPSVLFLILQNIPDNDGCFLFRYGEWHCSKAESSDAGEFRLNWRSALFLFKSCVGPINSERPKMLSLDVHWSTLPEQGLNNHMVFSLNLLNDSPGSNSKSSNKISYTFHSQSVTHSKFLIPVLGSPRTPE